MTLKSAYRLQTYTKFARFFLSRELNKIEIEHENKSLKLHGQEIKNGTEPKQLRVRNRILQIYVNDNQKILITPDNGRAAEQSIAWLPQNIPSLFVAF